LAKHAPSQSCDRVVVGAAVIESVPLGVSAEHIVTANIGLGLARYQTPTQQQQFWETLEQRMARIPDVQAFALSDTLPPSGGVHSMLLANIDVDGRASAIQGTGGSIVWRGVTPGYFDALGIRVIRGRGFTEQDRANSADVVVLSESLAPALFPNGDAIGQRVTFGKQPPWCTVIGSAGSGTMASCKLAILSITVCASEARTSAWMRRHTADDGLQSQYERRPCRKPMEPWIKGEITAIDPTLPVELGTMQQRVGTLTARPRFDAELLTAFAIVGLLLAAIGLYGVMAFLVAQRTQEIGVRMAFGATPTNIARLVLSYAGRWTSIGVAIGLVCAWWTTRLMHALLFGTSTVVDTWLIGGTVLLLSAISGVASWAPARRAARLDPVVALRHE
jgi:predicted permease